MKSGHDVTRAFEAALCEYTDAKYAVTTTSCTMAIQIALTWCICKFQEHDFKLRPDAKARGLRRVVFVEMPRRSYVGVPASIINAGGRPTFRSEKWKGEYQLKPFGATEFEGWPSFVFDSARRFTSAMFVPGTMQCVSFHWSKILGLSQGGAILHDNDDADAWLRRARFDGRTEGVDPKDDDVQYPSWHAYLSPEVAAHGLMKLASLPLHNEDLPNSDYPDLSKMTAFK